MKGLMVYRLSDTDIRLLHVFRAVVECRGFSNAQAVLNVGQPTISSHISQLEQRLGFRLCDRGRTGFRLTRKGESVYEQTLLLFKAHENFQNITLELKGKLSGFLKLGLIDSTVTDSNSPIIRSLEMLNNKANEIAIRLSILTPNHLEKAVLDGDVDIAFGTFDQQLPNLRYKPVYTEHNTLYCSYNHPIARLTKESEIRQAIADSRKVTRSYLEGEDLFPLGSDHSVNHASVEFLEAAAIMLLAGGHIGFLPNHYAKMWEERGKLFPILRDEYTYTSEFFIVTRKNLRGSVIVETFLEDLDIAIAEIKANDEANQGL
ncbi:HTH-type transcriptional regulator CynR [Falsiruegeria litorea R37]|uniref:HTH-type transcriptional regulator CynR n=1 Tax=Falsiruegeria litorea R37 TaxID=1200284 RepID=A0A1Y5TU26_9RHOB|nr:LysR family transcriptional regulator [Falsiruegeria litorea]SLN71677.1 HTH-type transcriptional regulator CynR [Falsiruegeria litorea R37]